MKKALLIIAALLVSLTAAAAQEKVTQKAPEVGSEDRFVSKIIEVHNQDPRAIADAIRMLGSGVGRSGVSVNTDLRTITIRDFPENVAAMEQAVKRLDRPSEIAPGIGLTMSVLVGSTSPLPDAVVPDDLAPVVKQLRTALRYSHYGLLMTIVAQPTTGKSADGSGAVEPALFGSTLKSGLPVTYHYNLVGIRTAPSATDQPLIAVDAFNFSIHAPLPSQNSAQYENFGFATPVSIRPGEKVVIGTTTLADKALIVVVTANVMQTKQ